MKFGTSETAAFGRLSVETSFAETAKVGDAAAFGRLSVETVLLGHRPLLVQGSRLRAAEC